MRMIRKFGCADGWTGIVRYDSFARFANSHIADGGSIYAHGVISYGAPGPKLIIEMFQDTTCNMLIKTPKHDCQREYRVIGSQPVEHHLKPDAKRPGCKTEENGLLLQQKPLF